MISLLDDLERRINPEKSRNFQESFYITRLHHLNSIYRKITELYPRKPLKISIVGTNGKGSTGFFLSQMFHMLGHRVGFYSSPHLLDFRERILIGMEIPGLQTLQKTYEEFYGTVIYPDFSRIYPSFTYFEVLTIFCVFLFYYYNLDVQIYEAGLGGRLDATKVVSPDAVILTSIHSDHTRILGHTHLQILKEKLGIISSETKKLFLGDSKIKNLLKLVEIQLPETFLFSDSRDSLYLTRNKKFAYFVFKILTSRSLTLSQLKSLKPPRGRMEVHKIKNRYFIYDVAHNASAIYRFLLTLKKKYPAIRKDNSLIFTGLLKDRRYIDVFRLWKWTKIKDDYPLPFIIKKEEFLQQHHPEERVFSLENFHPDSYREIEFFIFCGSFRVYPLFLQVIQNFRERTYG